MRDSASPIWIDDALRLPIAFAQVREDALLDLAVVDRLPTAPKIMMVASGGCTGAALAASGRVGSLEIVDPNPAQIALTRLKLRLLTTAEPAERMTLLGHAECSAGQRAERLAAELAALDLPADALGPTELVAGWGPDQAGRYERVFAALRSALGAQATRLAALLRLADPQRQAAGLADDVESQSAIERAFDEVMSQANLVRLFGEAATNNRVVPFARHFADRTRHVLTTLPAADNPYLWQVLAGRYPEGRASPWLLAPRCDKLPEIGYANTPMATALTGRSNQFDLVHLSNILDWLSVDEARRTLELAAAALKRGGWVIVRQLNSSLDITELGGGFTWDRDWSVELHARDRSYFYRGLYVGQKR